ncbi:Maf family protein [Primorskyibacter marinus]|uniref:Maf family protein n=1 Tax=Primorskyibacter marinus TaxID=1977320 RepID=UPI000E308118|nr:Maf family nucleotide pyrophosphatase [Primorskyibacter marinus]
MTTELVLASGSAIRAQLLRNAGVQIRVAPAVIDEISVRRALEAEGAPPRDVADTLAEMKAKKASSKAPDHLVLGCDQVLAVDRKIISKPATPQEARDQLMLLRDRKHQLLSAAVIYKDGKPTWRHVSTARLTMRAFSESYIDGYIDRNWQSIQHSVGGYKLEEEGVRLFARVEGDYFTILGLPLLELLGYLTISGVVEE